MSKGNKFLLFFSQRTTAQVVAVFLLLCTPMVFAPFISDDFFHLLMLSGKSPLPATNDASLWGLFSFIQQDAAYREALQLNGVLPWWAGESFYFVFWRPLAELSHWLDYTIAPHNSIFAHLHSIAWFVAFALLFKRMMQQLSIKPSIVFLAFIIFLFDGHHASVIEWIANRNALMSGFFIFLSLFLHIKARDEHNTVFIFLALMSLVLALLSGEAALAGGGYFFAYALFLDKRGFKKGFVAILPYLFVVLVWMALHHKLGFGSDGSLLLYIDPLRQPIEFIKALLVRLPMSVFFLLGMLPAETFPLMMFFGESFSWLYLAIALVLIAFLTYFCWSFIRNQAVVLFFLVGSLISIIPFCSLINQDRLLLIPSVGMSVVIAFLIRELFSSSFIHFSAWRKYMLKTIAITLLLVHVFFAAIYLFVAGNIVSVTAKTDQAKILQLDTLKEAESIIILKGSILNGALFKVIRSFEELSIPKQVLLLSDFSKNISLTRTSERELTLARQEGFVYRYEESFRDLQKEPFVAGDTISIGSTKLEVLEVNDNNQPLQLRLQLNDELQAYRFLVEESGGYAEVYLPAVGETVSL